MNLTRQRFQKLNSSVILLLKLSDNPNEKQTYCLTKRDEK
jgi:hypothetical protein